MKSSFINRNKIVQGLFILKHDKEVVKPVLILLPFNLY